MAFVASWATIQFPNGVSSFKKYYIYVIEENGKKIKYYIQYLNTIVNKIKSIGCCSSLRSAVLLSRSSIASQFEYFANIKNAR